MGWALLVVVIIIAALAVPRLGKVLLGITGLVVVGGVLVFAAAYWMEQQDRREREIAKTRIGNNEVELVDLVLQPGYGSGAYKLVGRLRNKSTQYALAELRLQITMRDCSPTGTCEVVGESDERIYAAVPPGQARDLDESVRFSGLQKARGEHVWDYRLTETVGR